MRGMATRGTELSFGEFGLQAMECAWVTDRQIEAARLSLVSAIHKKGKMWIRIFPDKPVTKKPAETRMGSGKGDVDRWVCVVKPGRMLFEMSGISEEEARRVTRLASFKLPIRTRFVSRGS